MSRLLNESWIEGLPDNIVENLESLNNYIVQRICERIRKIGEIGATDAHRLRTAIEYAGADLEAIEKEVARIMGMNQREVERLFEEVAEENIEFSNTYYKARDMDTLHGYKSRSALSSFVDAAKLQALDGTANISNTYMIGFKRGTQIIPLREYYISAIDRAITYAQTGVVNYQSAIRSTVKEMARSGLRRLTWESGYSRRLDSSARMNILEGIRRLNGEMMEETGREFGADGVEISAHGLCAPDHRDIQGKQYSKEEFERLNRRLERPIGTLNCHHFVTPIVLGVSKPVYSRKELAEINRRSSERVEYKGQKMSRYEASQKQRKMETAIRYAKDERDAMVAAGDKLGATQARKKSAALSAEYKRFCEQVGLTPRPERTRSMTGPTVQKI
jgi:AraC-like DNA-binding protein